MMFAKTRVEPPIAIGAVDQYAEAILESVSQFAKLDSDNESEYDDKLYALTKLKIDVFLYENRITTQTGDDSIDKLFAAYVPRFLKRSFDAFKQRTWRSDDHKYMLSVAAKLKKVKHSDNTMALTQKDQESINLMEDIISDYNDAWRISSQVVFSGVENAKKVIQEASAYTSDEYLKNCAELVSALNRVKPAIAQSHYEYVQEQVDRLKEYKFFGEDYYKKRLVPEVTVAVKGFKELSALYGMQDKASSIERISEDLWATADIYYKGIEAILQTQ